MLILYHNVKWKHWLKLTQTEYSVEFSRNIIGESQENKSTYFLYKNEKDSRISLTGGGAWAYNFPYWGRYTAISKNWGRIYKNYSTQHSVRRLTCVPSNIHILFSLIFKFYFVLLIKNCFPSLGHDISYPENVCLHHKECYVSCLL